MNELDGVLESKCPSCGGRKGFSDGEEEGGWRDCARCNASGFVPTPMGARILDLIRHNSRVTVSAELLVASSR